MSFNENMQTITLEAAAAIAQYSFVIVDGNGRAAIAPLAGTSTAIIGVAQNAATALGDSVTVAVSGVSKVIAATGGVTAGTALMVAVADGQVTTHTGSTVKVGVALTTAAAGKFASALIGGSKPIS